MNWLRTTSAIAVVVNGVLACASTDDRKVSSTTNNDAARANDTESNAGGEDDVITCLKGEIVATSAGGQSEKVGTELQKRILSPGAQTIRVVRTIARDGTTTTYNELHTIDGGDVEITEKTNALKGTGTVEGPLLDWFAWTLDIEHSDGKRVKTRATLHSDAQSFEEAREVYSEEGEMILTETVDFTTTNCAE